jgi:hypothetical protein
MRTDRSALALRAASSVMFVLGTALGVLLLTGCPGTLDDKQRFLVDGGSAGRGSNDAAPPGEPDAGLGPCGDVVARIFDPSCGGTGCHGGTGAQQNLDLVSPGVAARVVGVSGVGCASILADPANPESSLIYQKLSPTPPCGSPMPLARPALSDEDAACVLAWIAAQQ